MRRPYQLAVLILVVLHLLCDVLRRSVTPVSKKSPGPTRMEKAAGESTGGLQRSARSGGLGASVLHFRVAFPVLVEA